MHTLSPFLWAGHRVRSILLPEEFLVSNFLVSNRCQAFVASIQEEEGVPASSEADTLPIFPELLFCSAYYLITLREWHSSSHTPQVPPVPPHKLRHQAPAPDTQHGVKKWL